jgi:hypothetical protein
VYQKHNQSAEEQYFRHVGMVGNSMTVTAFSAAKARSCP